MSPKYISCDEDVKEDISDHSCWSQNVGQHQTIAAHCKLYRGREKIITYNLIVVYKKRVMGLKLLHSQRKCFFLTGKGKEFIIKCVEMSSRQITNRDCKECKQSLQKQSKKLLNKPFRSSIRKGILQVQKGRWFCELPLWLL